MTLRRFRSTTARLLALAALGAATVASAETPHPQAVRGADVPAPATPLASPGALIKEGQPPALFLMYTGDVIGYLEPCG